MCWGCCVVCEGEGQREPWEGSIPQHKTIRDHTTKTTRDQTINAIQDHPRTRSYGTIRPISPSTRSTSPPPTDRPLRPGSHSALPCLNWPEWASPAYQHVPRSVKACFTMSTASRGPGAVDVPAWRWAVRFCFNTRYCICAEQGRQRRPCVTVQSTLCGICTSTQQRCCTWYEFMYSTTLDSTQDPPPLLNGSLFYCFGNLHCSSLPLFRTHAARPVKALKKEDSVA